MNNLINNSNYINIIDSLKTHIDLRIADARTKPAGLEDNSKKNDFVKYQ